MKVKEEHENVGFKLNIQKINIMTSGTITSWEIDEETVETVSDYYYYYYFVTKITADGDYSHEMQRHLLLGRKVMTNLDSIFGEGDGTPLHYPCLNNPKDCRSWWAAICGVTKSWTGEET